MAASGCLPAADRHVMFWICGVGDPAANQKNRAAVHCGYHKAAAVTHGYRLKNSKEVSTNSVDTFPV